MELLATKDAIVDEKHSPSFLIAKVNCSLTPFLGRDRLSSDSKYPLMQIKLKSTTDPFPSLVLQGIAYQPLFPQSSVVPGPVAFLRTLLPDFFFLGKGSALECS